MLYTLFITIQNYITYHNHNEYDYDTNYISLTMNYSTQEEVDNLV